MTVILIIITILAGVIEGVYLIPRGMVKETIAAEIMLLIAIVLQITSRLGIIIIIGLIEKVFSPIGKMFLEKL